MDRQDRSKQHIALPTAVATAYFQVTGKQVDGRREERTQRTLCNIALALSAAAPIYSSDGPWDMPRQVQSWHLLGAKFERGAHVLALTDGTELRRLTIQRVDLERAVAVLKESFARGWDPDTP
jgi:hypothetical protein